MLEDIVHSSQRGFRKGKVITDNVIELEARIMKGMYTGAGCPALLLIEIKAAFLSVAWDWLWDVLDLMGCPGWLVYAVKALYTGSTAQLLLVVCEVCQLALLRVSNKDVR